MIGKEFGREPPRLKDVKIMLNTFDDLEHPLTQKLLSSIEENENELVARADALYHTLTDAGGAFAFQDAITFLSGL